MRTLCLEDLILRGDISARAGLLAARLEKREYRPETILTMDKSGWPGDWEGRTILALVSLARATKKEPSYLHEIVDTVLSSRGERGYLGHILPDGEADEQQLSGHSWLLRGLLAYYEYTGREDILSAAIQIGSNLYLPLSETYRSYPVRPEDRTDGGEASGHVAKTVGKWHISTDTGCAYIPLDGISALYAVTRDPALLSMLEQMINDFIAIDFTGIKVQTHATLTALRGILRTYSLTGQKELLHAAVRIFTLYTEEGMTAGYANYNWFGRPEWTEPCAVIDSFICAMQLYNAVGDRKYLTLAQRILYNAIGFGQRENGGFGCDTCLGAAGIPDNHILRVLVPEAYWCCSMRGGEGFAAIGSYAFLTEEEKRNVVIPYPISCEARLSVGSEVLSFAVNTRYPLAGSFRITVRNRTLTRPITLSVYIPDTAEVISCNGADYRMENGFLIITVAPQTAEIECCFHLPRHTEKTVGVHNDKSRKAIFEGNMMLAVKAKEHEVFPTLSDAGLEPLYLAYETDHEPRQALFAI